MKRCRLGLSIFLILTTTCNSSPKDTSNSDKDTSNTDPTRRIYLLKTDKTNFLSNPGFSSNGKIKVIGYEVGDSLRLFNDKDCTGLDISTIYTIDTESYFDVTFIDGVNNFSIKKSSKGNEECISHVTYTKSYFDSKVSLTSTDGYLNASWNYPKFMNVGDIQFRTRVLPGSIDISSYFTNITFKDLAISTYKVKVSAIDNDESEATTSDLIKLLASSNRPSPQIIGNSTSMQVNNNNFIMSSYNETSHSTHSVLRKDGTVYYWRANSDITKITGNEYITIGGNFALKKDGTVYQTSTANPSGKIIGSDYTEIIELNGLQTFVALKKDNTIYTWGKSNFTDTFTNIPLGIVKDIPGSNYVMIATTGLSFIALREDGTISDWGYESKDIDFPGSDYIAIAGTRHNEGYKGTYIALKKDGTIYYVALTVNGIMKGTISGSDYIAIANSSSAFAALKKDGTVHAFHHNSYNPNVYEKDIPEATNQVVTISANKSLFAALKKDGTIYSWPSNQLVQEAGKDVPGSNYVSMAGNDYAFAALKEDGTIYSWGDSRGGAIGNVLGSGYVAVVGDDNWFSALREDGTVYSWGSNWNKEISFP